MRVLGDFDIDSSPDIAIRKAHPADRWLLCSDGLCGVLEDSTLQEVLSACSDQEECAQQLVSMAPSCGSTDNVTAVIADATLALDADAFDLPHQTPLVGGAASASLEPIADIINEPGSHPLPHCARARSRRPPGAAALRNGKNPNEDDNPPEQRVAQPSTVREENGDRTNPDTGEIPVVQKDDGRISADPNDPEVAKAIRNEHIEQRKTKRTRTRRNRVIAIIVTIVVLLGLAGGAFATYRWSQTKYYIGDDNGEVAIFQGVPTSLFGFQLSHAVTDTHMKTSELPPSWQEQLAQGISFDTYGEAKTHTRLIKKQLKQQQDEAAQKEQDKANGESDNKSSGTTSDKSSGKSDKSTTLRQTSQAVTSHDGNPSEAIRPAAVQHADLRRRVLPDVRTHHRRFSAELFVDARFCRRIVPDFLGIAAAFPAVCQPGDHVLCDGADWHRHHDDRPHRP